MEKYFTLIDKVQFLIDKASRKTKPTQRAVALQVIAEALEHIALISESCEKSSYLNDVARVCVEIGLTEKCIEVLNQALEVAQTLPDKGTKATELSEIGSCYVQTGLTDRGLKILDQALQIAKALEDVDERDLTLCHIASEYREVGQIDVAIEIAALVKDEYEAAFRIFDYLVGRFIYLERHDEVQRLIAASSYEQIVILGAINAYAQIGEYARILQFMEEVELPVNKISALTDLAEAYLKAGQNDKASETLDQAFTIAATLQDKNARSFARDTVALIRAKIEE